ncbi:MAG: winged helix-turn-helix transcriptional regulator [Clostridia bacterium]
MKSKARGSRTGRPIMVALDLLGRRGTLRILWELRHGEPMTFRSLQAAAETNPALLNTRLGELRSASLVGHEGEGYLLTTAGRELLEALQPFSAWAKKWGERRS